jgi:hypothetical protein
MVRTYQVYADLTFLGYEYAETEQEAQTKTIRKFGPADIWNCKKYTTTLIELVEA